MKDSDKIAVFKALADPTRIKLVRSLASCPTGQKSCSELSSRSELSQPAMSHHFAKLASAGIIVDQKVGTQKSYLINRDYLDKLGIDINKL